MHKLQQAWEYCCKRGIMIAYKHAISNVITSVTSLHLLLVTTVLLQSFVITVQFKRLVYKYDRFRLR